MDPTDVDRRFAELVTAEFGERAMRGDRGAPHEADVEVPARPTVTPQPQPRPRTPEPPTTPVTRIIGPAHDRAHETVNDGDHELGDDVDYRSPSASSPLPADIRIAATLLGVGMVVLLLAGFVLNVPANLVWVGPVAAGGSLVWLLVRALRRPPRDPDDDGIHL